MAAGIVGGAFLSAALQVVFERLASHNIQDYFSARKRKDGLLKKLEITLNSVYQLLEDAEEKQFRNPNVKKWLDELKHTVYETEELLDEIATEASRQKLEAEFQTTISKVRGLLTALVKLFDKEIESRIKELLDNLEFLAKQKELLYLTKGSSPGSVVGVGRELSKRLPTTSLVDESGICGRKGDKEEIMKFLRCANVSGNRLPVITIVGMGGMGKTTLAQLVYNDKMVENEFQLKAWICVSEEFDVVRITKDILAALKCSREGSASLDQLQVELKDKLFGKKFLLVLDDVWNEDHLSWEAMQVPFTYGALGSKILVTTRSEKVASVMDSLHVYPLKPLKEEDCWALFTKLAFNDKDANAYPNLESIGQKIVQKCKGLPLAIKTMGSLLYTKFSHQEWVKVLESDIWNLSESESSIIPALRLSYHYLPSHLKRCFAFCSIFPKDYVFHKDVLIQMWMAEGLIHCRQGHKNAEDVGSEFFDDLVSRSFFQPTEHVRFMMHDLLNALAKYVSGEFYSRVEGDEVCDIPTKARYFSSTTTLTIDDYDKVLKPTHKCKLLHTFMFMNPRSNIIPCSFSVNRKVLGGLLSRLKYLRILSLSGCVNIKELDEDISKLKHLRYLDISFSPIEILPDSICMLYNLQILKLQGCCFLAELPSDLHKLINLRYLDVSGTKINRLPDSVCLLHNLHTFKLSNCNSLEELPPNLHQLVNLHCLNFDGIMKEMPMHMGVLTHLQSLNRFIVGNHSGCSIMELGKLNCLEGTLQISELQNISDPKDAGEANMNRKFLDELELEWSENNEDSQNERSVLEALQPHANLKKLSIKRYGGTSFPDWFDAPYLPNLVSLLLHTCKYCFCLPPLGQLSSLKQLYIFGLNGIKTIGAEFYGNILSGAPTFRSLEILSFECIGEWEEWMYCEDECFPCLQELRVIHCPKLTKTLPAHLPALKRLHIQDCQALQSSLPKVCALGVLVLDRCGNMSVKEVPSSLTRLYISGSVVDESLLHQVLVTNPKLESISIHEMSNLKSLPKNMHTLLPSIRSLVVRKCSKLNVALKEWGLNKLHYLQEFQVSGNFENVESFPEERLLPANLETLGFFECSNLKSINYRGLLHLKSLKKLAIGNCQNLQCLPEETLPNSLHYLYIEGNSPLLKQRYEKDKGQDWHKISHIPQVKIW